MQCFRKNRTSAHCARHGGWACAAFRQVFESFVGRGKAEARPEHRKSKRRGLAKLPTQDEQKAGAATRPR